MLEECTEDGDLGQTHDYDQQPSPTPSPAGQRWDPLGASDFENQLESYESHFESNSTNQLQCYPHERVRALEEEQEFLNLSLFQLSTHFAQVQFRLRQVVDAPPSEKEHLLKSLEEFAFRGVNDTATIPKLTPEYLDRTRQDRLSQRQLQLELIEQLKSHLSELENFTFETESPEFLSEKQRVLIDELKQKISRTDENRSEGDGASCVSPHKMKEQLVNQFKTQIADLERFIMFLQEGSSDLVASARCTCSCPVHGLSKALNHQAPRYYHDDNVRSHTIGIMKRAATLLQMFVVMQFGCGNAHFKRNVQKACYNHWGDLRARLEIVIGCIEEIMKNRPDLIKRDHPSGGYGSDLEEPLDTNSKLTSLVRKKLAPTIRDLMQHGLIEANKPTSIVPFMMCFAAKNEEISKKIHAWELILQYYELKNGEIYNTTPARKLSESFSLEIADSRLVSNKQFLLSTIGSIIATHTPYKRSCDSHFKAFICAALNANKLVIWLTMILQCKHLILNHYHSWSYVLKTGFQDSLQSLDRLTQYKFDLPVDLAVRHFQSIKDVFM